MRHPIFPLQTSMAKRVIHEIIKNERMYVSLCAPMQSGKTGMIIEIARLYKKFGKTYFLTAVADKDVRSQNAKAFDGTSIVTIEKFSVNDLVQKSTLNELSKLVKKGSLVVLDEAHFGIGSANMLSSIFTYLVDNLNCKLVAVSATNFVFQESHLGNKAVVVGPSFAELKSSGYISVSEILPNVHDLGDNTSPYSNLRSLMTALDKFKAHKEPGYFIMRESSKSIYDKHKNDGLFDGMDVILWDSKSEDGFTPAQLQVRPTKPTLVLIKGYLRLGKVLPKTFIHAVWESSKGNVSSVAQGVVGRVCGYDPQALQISIYAQKALVESYEKYMLSSFNITANMLAHIPENSKLDRRVNIKKIKTGGVVKRLTADEAGAILSNPLQAKTAVHHLKDHNKTSDVYHDYRKVVDGKYSGRGIYKGKGMTQMLLVVDNTDGSDSSLPHGFKEYFLNIPSESSTVEYSAKSTQTMYNLPKGYNEKAH